ncbi:MAG: type IV secretory system conjugative DNA transfer family protein [Candidatus Pacebacteria bacterium]|nr:type IV secretory system conjugative DNA transfer family protein [Candidatus Paceibacterota bacterium]
MNPSLDHLNDEDQVTYFGETDARNRRLRFGIKRKDRAKHLYAIGKTGMGKSTLLENLAVQDILNGEGLCFLDPHGKSADLLLEYVPEHRIKDVIYFAPFDMEYPVSFNVMEDVGPEQRYLVASGMMSAFKKIWVDAWSARMEYILGNIMLALLEYPGSTLVAVNRMLTDKDFRKEVVNHISDPSVKSFWVNEYANYTEKFAAEAAPAIQNKVGQFVANPLIRNIIGQPKSSFDIRDVMDNRKILIINLSKGRVGEANANLLGSMLITKIYLGAMSRADLNEKQLEAAPNFYLYVDEFQSFANESFADILSEARKYKLSLSIAHQYIEQMTEEVRAAVFGNVGTMVTYRVGAYDAEILEKEFAPHFLAEDIVALQKYQMYLKLMIDGVTSPPFSAAGMAPIPRSEINYTNDILASSRALYAKPRQQVEDELLAWIQKKFGGSSGSSGGGGSNSGGGNGSGGNGASSGGNSNGGASGGGNGTSSNGGNNSDRSRGSSQGGGSFSGSRSSGGAQRDGRTVNSAQSSSQNSYRGSVPQGSNRSSSGGGRDSRPASTAPVSDRNRATSTTPSSTNSSSTSSSLSLNNTRPNVQDSLGGPPTSQGPANSAPRSQNIASGGMSGTISGAMSEIVSGSTDGTSPQNARQSGQQSSQQFQQTGNERESELRKAMSLSYLKTEAPAPKPEKIPKPENIAALREALLSVMKNEGMTTAQTVPSVTVSSSTPAPASENKQQPVSINSSMNQSVHVTKNVLDEKVEKEVFSKKDMHKESNSVKNIREVNESDLKDIFAE